MLAGFNIRPGARECLQEAGKYFEVVAFTASVKSYADTILDHLDPDGTLIHHRLYRDSCILNPDSGVYIKDLRIFEGWSMEDLILVDNAVYSFAHQPDNGIPCISFYHDTSDDQLLRLIDYMPTLASIKDVRKRIRHYFQISELLKDPDLHSLYTCEDHKEECDIDAELEYMTGLCRRESIISQSSGGTRPKRAKKQKKQSNFSKRETESKSFRPVSRSELDNLPVRFDDFSDDLSEEGSDDLGPFQSPSRSPMDEIKAARRPSHIPGQAQEPFYPAPREHSRTIVRQPSFNLHQDLNEIENTTMEDDIRLFESGFPSASSQ